MTCRCAPNARCGRCFVLTVPPRHGKMQAFREWQREHPDNSVFDRDVIERCIVDSRPPSCVEFEPGIWFCLPFIVQPEPQWRPYEPDNSLARAILDERINRCPRCARRPSKSMGCPTERKEVRR